MRFGFDVLAVAVLFLASAGVASALPRAGFGVADAGGDVPPVILAHGCHFDMGPNMAPDRENGPHYHDRQCRIMRVGPGGPRHAAPPPPPPQQQQRHWRQQGGYGYGYGPPRRACREQCRYIGPIKTCKTVCN